ncbi:MAG: hypothetical protein GQ574_14605 [Crocinitomix sp.]|nr:hypothetical protein [Crocinitomix sp.]
MKSKLTKGVPQDEKKEIRASFLEALQFRKRLTIVLEDEIKTLQTSMRAEANFDSPNWAYIQADRVAQTKALERVISLINED